MKNKTELEILNKEILNKAETFEFLVSAMLKYIEENKGTYHEPNIRKALGKLLTETALSLNTLAEKYTACQNQKD